VELRRPQLEQAPQLQGGNEGIGEGLPREDRDRRDGCTVDLGHQDGTVGNAGGVKVCEPPERCLVVGACAADGHRAGAEIRVAIAIL
jgi:hypothetical protein